MDDLNVCCFCLLLFRINAGIIWPGSIQRAEIKLYDCDGRVGGQASYPTGTSVLHRRFVGVDSTLLGPGPSVAPGDPRSLADIFFLFHELRVLEVEAFFPRLVVPGQFHTFPPRLMPISCRYDHTPQISLIVIPMDI